MEKEIRKMTIEFEDGSLLEVDAATLTAQIAVQLELWIANSRKNTEKRFVLLEWLDGWKEVVSVPADSEGLVRYYVIQRQEYTGRLVIDRKGSEYPELLEIIRKPKELKKVTIV